MIYMMDVRGSCPLSYVQERDCDEWMRFFMLKSEIIWPHLGKREHRVSSCLASQLPNTRPLKNPRIVLPHAIIKMLAAGRMNPEEVMFLCQTYEDEEDLHSFFDEDFSFNIASQVEESTSSALDDESCASRSNIYDEVSAMSRQGPADSANGDFRRTESISSTTTFNCPSQHCNNQSLGSPPRVTRAALRLQEHKCCQVDPPIFPVPCFYQGSNSLGEKNVSRCDQKLIIETPFEHIHHPSQVVQSEHRINHKKYDSDVANGRNNIGIAASDRLSVHLLKNGLYCLPEDESGLLFGSC